MKITNPNIILFDTKNDVEDFINGVSAETKADWQALYSISNKKRKNKLYNLVRYFKYFWFPFRVFLHRKKIKNLIGWQAFYGFVFAFYCSLFHVKKTFTITIKNFTYKPKKGFFSKLYEWFIRKTVSSGYVDTFIVTSPDYGLFCSNVLNAPPHLFKGLKFAVSDSASNTFEKTEYSDYVLSIGRSNRDWEFAIKAFSKSSRQLIIICDAFRTIPNDLPSNITILNNVSPADSLRYIYSSSFVFIPILDGRIASGETVLATAMCFSKPVIITKPSTLAEFYVEDGFNGYSIEKKESVLLEKVELLFNNKQLLDSLSANSRKSYEKSFSLFEYGKSVGRIILEYYRG